MTFSRFLNAAAAVLVICGGAGVAYGDTRADRVVVVYNADDPESRSLAEYYAQKRSIPTNQLCAIHAPVVETISRKDYNDNIRDPVWQFLTRQGLLTQERKSVIDPVLGKIPWLVTVDSKIFYIVLMYGVPLRIDPDPTVDEKLPKNAPPEFRRNEASVESELALLPTEGVQLSGFLKNPFYSSGSSPFGPPLNRKMFLVGRLDGPDPPTVRRMIDDALTAEHFGLQGRAYFDARGTTAEGYVQGDNWIRLSYRAICDAGYECEFDNREQVFDEDYPMTDVAVYAGWYEGSVTGPFKRKDFRFKTGAIAYHIHSFSAETVRTRTDRWVGPLLAKGAAATMGNVYEPYLSYTPHLDLFFQRLLNGAPFLEAAYDSEPVLSWQTTFIGDPLYRPFLVPLDEQIERLQAAKNPDVQWAYLRQVNLLAANGEPGEAENLCRDKAESLGSKVLYEKLGDLLHVTHRDAAAIAAYQNAIHEPENSSYQFIRVATKMASTYESNQQAAQALTVYEGLIQAYPANRNVLDWYKRARELAHAAGDTRKERSLQAKIDELLQADASDAGKKK